MIRIEYRSPLCSSCWANCCGCIPNVHPILMPWEYFPDLVIEKRGQLAFLKTNAQGQCVYLLDGKCTVYECRPFECQAYPLLLQFDGHGTFGFRPRLRLDPRATCYRESLNKGSSFEISLSYVFPADWVKEFMAVSGSVA